LNGDEMPIREAGQNSVNKKSLYLNVGFQSLLCVLASSVVTAIVMHSLIGEKPVVTVPTVRIWRMGMMISIFVPLTVAPYMIYRLSVLVEKLKQAHARLEDVARQDALTGLLNRRGVEAAAAAIWESAGAGTVSALMCDIDRFKAINDAFGHEIGDRALVHVAALLRATIDAPRAVLGRHGGEEFAVLLPDVGPEEAGAWAEKLRAACEANPLRFETTSVPVTLSIGLCADAPARSALGPLLDLADRGLYQAKQRGRNRVVAATPSSSAREPAPDVLAA
jgi:diguanylate cyclase (GGDEF)-like protein